MHFLIQAQRETWPQNPLEQKNCKHVSGIITPSPWLVLALNPWDEPAMLCLAAFSVPWFCSLRSFIFQFPGGVIHRNFSPSIPMALVPSLRSCSSPWSDHTLCPLEQHPRASLWKAGTAIPGSERVLTSDSCTWLGQLQRGPKFSRTWLSVKQRSTGRLWMLELLLRARAALPRREMILTGHASLMMLCTEHTW